MAEKARKPRKSYTAEFKKQMCDLYESGKSRADIIREYDLTPSALDRWIKQNSTTGSFTEKENRTEEENELIELRKKIKQLELENEILKQAALIIGRR